MNIADMTEDQILRRFEGLVVKLVVPLWMPWRTVIERDDAMQSGRMALLHAARNYRPGGGAVFITYASCCIYRKAKDYIHREAAKITGKKYGMKISRCGDFDRKAGDAKVLPDSDDAKAVWNAAASLAPQMREAFRLRYREGMTTPEIGRAMNTASNAATLIRAAEKNIKTQLALINDLKFPYKPRNKKGERIKPNQLKRYTHKNGSFPEYSYVESDGETVWGMRRDGLRVVTGWEAGAPEHFVSRGLWVEL